MQVETVEKNKVKLTFEVGPEKFEEGLKHSYNKNKAKLYISGFRKGKAPRKIIEVQYGKEVLFDDAIQFVLGEAYDQAVKEQNIETVSKPEIDVVSVSTEDGVVFAAEVFVMPEVILGDYLGATYKKTDATVTEEEITAQIDIAREKNARVITVTDRKVQKGDIVTIDFAGSIDGVPFEGGTGESYELTIGSNTFIPGFEDQIIGHELKDVLAVTVTFPEEYHEEALKGKEAVFQVEIHEIKAKEMPEVDDDFAQDVSEFDTLEAYRASIIDTLAVDKNKSAENQKENDVLEFVTQNATMDVPQVMIDNQVNQMVEEFAQRIKRQGLPFEMYLQYMGHTIDSLKQSYMQTAEKQVKGRLVLEAVAAAENIEASDEELNEEIAKIAEVYKMELAQLLTVMGDKDKASIRKDIGVRKALDVILASAVEMDVVEV